MQGSCGSEVAATTASTTLPTSTTTQTTVPITTAPLSPFCGVVNISLLSSVFLPNRVTVRAGDVIQFVWVSGFHYVVDTTNNAELASCDETLSAWVSGSPTNVVNTTFRVSTAGLAPGTYRFACPIHCNSMIGSFEVSVRDLFV
jgi:plastocyanin